MPESNKEKTISGAAGLSGGTGFAGMVLLMPDGVTKSILLILSPAITIIISSSWHIVTQEIESKIADWRIRQQKERAQELYDRLDKDPNADIKLKEIAKKNLADLTVIEVEVTKRRVDSILSS